MTSIDSNEVTSIEAQNQNDNSTIEVIPTNSDQRPSISDIPYIDEVTMFTSEITTNNEALYSFCKENSILNTLTIGDLGNIEIQAELQNNRYGITLLPCDAEPDFDKLVVELNSLEEQPPQNNCRPNLGDLICGQKLNEDWVRGYIVSKLPYLKMAVVDEAIIAIVNNVAACDTVSTHTCAFGALCEVIDPGYKFQETDVVEFIVIGHSLSKEQGAYEILILVDDDRIRATLKPWIPTPEQIGLPCAEVNNGSEVCVTGYRNHVHLFLCPINTVALEHYNHVMQTVARCAERSPFLWEPPAIGDMVIAQSADENYYRARVTGIEDGRITILYLDLGRKDVTDITKLKILPDNLKKLQYCMTKVILRDVPRDTPLIKEVDDYLAYIVATKVPLLCTYDGIPSIDGVYLKFPDGETVNNMICKFLKPKPMEIAE